MILQASQIALWGAVSILILLQIYILRQFKKVIPYNNGIPPGLAFPNIEVESLEGTNTFIHQLLDSKRPVMLCFVHYSCKFCRAMIPELDRITSQYPYFSVKLISFGEDKEIRRFVAETGTALPIFRVDSKVITKQLNIKRFPFGMIIDSDGIVMRRELVEKENLLTWLVDVPQFIESYVGEVEDASTNLS